MPIAQINTVDNHGEKYRMLYMFCPGCEDLIGLPIDERSSGPSWGFNGNLEAPTVTPSILKQHRHPKGHTNANPAPENYSGEYEVDICHSFVEDGNIRFLTDSTHKLAGQTVPLPQLPDWF